MRKVVLGILLSVCMLTALVGCYIQNPNKDEPAMGDLPPMITINGNNYFEEAMSIAELPEDYECIGELTDTEANDTGLAGCKYYANKYISSFDEFYVYQECGTPIDENTVDNTQRQWAYVKWVREGFHLD